MKVLEIERKDLIHNVKVIKENMNCQIIAVVKGNGYGLGLVQYTKFLRDNGIDFFAVATVEEALELRDAGITENILMLSSTSVKDEVEALIKNNIILTIGSKEAADVANSVAEAKIPIHIKIDTGFGRYGFLYDDIESIVQAISNNNKLKVEGCFSHFSDAYNKNSKWTIIQYNRFLNVIENLKLNNIDPGILHICNSSAAIKYPYMRLNAVRIGSAFTGRILVENKLGLKKIAKFKTNVVEIKNLPKGFNIGYSNTYRIRKNTNVAVLPIGYLDGINMSTNNDSFRFIDHIRYLYNDFKCIFKNNSIKVNINNKNYDVIGKIGLYNMVIDIKNDNIKIGDIAIIDVKALYVNSKIRREYI